MENDFEIETEIYIPISLTDWIISLLYLNNRILAMDTNSSIVSTMVISFLW